MQDWWLEERLAFADGRRTIAGIDEVGRGALAGPVVAACVVLPYEIELFGVDDSKKLTPEKRDELFDLVMQSVLGVGVGIVDAKLVDKINVLKATHEAMRLALANLPPELKPDIALIDGLPVRPFPIPQNALVKGDGRSISIAAASIIAKVTRDRLMLAFDTEFPGYGFASHKGYGVQKHLEAIIKQGPCAIHRLTFRPINPAPRPVKKSISNRPEFQNLSHLTPNLFEQSTSLHESPPAKSPHHPTTPSLPHPPRLSSKKLGDFGESVASAYLEGMGWRVIKRNYRCRAGEMDIIAEDLTQREPTLVFAEVKTRRGKRHGSPIEAVDARKQAKLISIALEWLGEANRGGEEPAIRFDVIEVFQEPGGLSKVTLHRGAYTG